MKLENIRFSLLLMCILPFLSFSQKGKDLDYTASALNTIVNTYTSLTVNASSGATSITVANATMSGGAFTGNLAAGDLILIIQMQGASMDINTTPVDSWGSFYTVPNSFIIAWDTNPWEWGQVTNYNNAGKFEQAEVKSVSGNTITLQCNLQNNYTAAGHVQIVRIPRFNNLTVNTTSSIIPQAWDGTTGGIVAVEVNGNLVLNAGSTISASTRGFRGGVVDAFGKTGSATPAGGVTSNGSTFLGTINNTTQGAPEGAEKGEGIGGFITEYSVVYSRYGRGAPANGGGGAGYQNCGGGGGANVGTGAYNGKGIPGTGTNYTTAWNLEGAGFAANNSSGGGRGGYSYSTSNQNAIAVGPNQGAWSGDARKVNGGFGGHPLAYDATRLFMGGGGGAGDQDSGQGGSGGAGGGIVFITCYGTISGSGTIESDGQVGQNTNPNNEPAGTGVKKGNDGAGGGGGGGAVFIKNSNPLPASITLSAKGGNGGNHNLSLGQFVTTVEGTGPGGAGAGGYIAFTSGTPTQNVSGGTSGVSNSAHLTEFTPNGATNGASGMSGLATTIFNITASNDTICSGNTATLTATVTGTLPGTLTWYTSAFGSVVAGTGTTLITPVLTTTTTYYVGVCPGTFRVPVTVVVNPASPATFNQIAPICSGGTITLPTASLEGYTGTWSPAVNNTATTLYTFTPSAGQCGSSTTMTITVNPSTTSTFNQVAPVCSGGSITLPSTSNEGFTGTWSPAINNTATTLYTFTPTAGQCASQATMTVTVNPATNSTFNQIAPICSGASLSLPSSSLEGFTGTWSPAVNNSATTLYTFTPTAGQCASQATMTVTVNATITPSFTQIAPICSGGTINLPTSSLEAITGSWSPAVNNTATTNYLFTPSAGQCATTTTMTVSVGSPVTPTFTQVAPICSGGSFTLPGTSNEGYTGTWAPAINNSATTLYTFSPGAGQCATSATMTVTVNAPIASTFNQISPICSGGVINLPTSSLEGTPGTWSPAVNNTATTLYLFTPSAGQCANTASMTVTVNPIVTPTFAQVAPICSGGSFTLPGTSQEGITGTWSPAINNSATTIYTFTPAAGQCANQTTMTVTVNAPVTPTFAQWGPFCQGDPLIQVMLPGTSQEGITGTWNPGMASTAMAGNILYSFTPNAGECANPTTMTIVVYPLVSPTFTQIAPICSGGSINLPASSLEGIDGTWSPAVNNTATTVYTFTANAGECATQATMTVTVGVPVNPTFTQIPPVCTGTSFSLPATSNEGFTGSWSPAVNTTTTTVYTFTPSAGQCATTTTMTVAVGSPVVPTFDQVDPICSGGTFALPSTSNEGFTGTWSPAINNTATTTYTFTPGAGQCALNGTMSVIVNPNPILGSNAMVVVNESCDQANGSISGIIVSSGSSGFTYEWNNDPLLTTLDISGLTGGAYSLTVTDSEGCTDQMNVIVGEEAAPVIDITALTIIQPSCTSPGSITGITATGSSALTYSWSGTSQTTLDIVGLTGGSYVLTVTDASGCSSSVSPIELTQPTGPSADFNWNPNVPNVNETVSLLDQSSGTIDTWLWTVEGQSFSSENLDHVFTSEGSYSVTLIVTDSDGCTDSITQNIQVFGSLVIPNVITPNGDGVNDLFEVKNLKPETQVLIVNRWGEIVFESENYQNDWDGKDVSGELLLEGVYTYKLTGADDQVYHGFVHLIR